MIIRFDVKINLKGENKIFNVKESNTKRMLQFPQEGIDIEHYDKKGRFYRIYFDPEIVLENNSIKPSIEKVRTIYLRKHKLDNIIQRIK